MKKQINSLSPLLILFVFVSILTGCEKTVTNIDLPPFKPKLVVGCFISPQDTLISVTVTYTSPIFNGQSSNLRPLNISDAKIIISDNTTSITIPYNAQYKVYQLASSLFPILAGKTYYLNVSTPRGENVSATCTVPTSNITSLSVDYIDTIPTSEEKKINIRWNDIPNETNYYQVTSIMCADTIDIYGLLDINYILKDDIDYEGKELVANMGMFGKSYTGRTFFRIYVLNMDAGYYKYQYSLEHYSGNDPFSEPSPIYTNIKNGLGIFAAYQKYYKAVP